MATANADGYYGDITNQVIASGSTTTLSPAPSGMDARALAFPVNEQGIPVNKLYGYNPKRYSGKILRKFYESCVLTQISNTDYEGEIKSFGDTVIIRTTPDIVVDDYVKGQDLKYRVYETDTVELQIDKGKYWAFTTNPIDVAQTDIKSFTEKWTSEASLRMKIAIEKDVFGYLVTSGTASSDNVGKNAGAISHSYDLGTSEAKVTLTNANIVSKIVDAGSVLAEQNIPVQSESCWMVVDQKAANLLSNSELKAAFLAGDGKASFLKNGQYNLPHIDCFDIYRSNILGQIAATDSTGYIVFGHNSALTFASQITENEVLPNPNGFGKLHRGLMIYGFEVVQPKALGLIVCTYGSANVGLPVSIDGAVTVGNTTANPVPTQEVTE